MSRKPTRNTSALAPITPDIAGTPSAAALNIELTSVRRMLRAERIRHGKLEAALTRYNELLEKAVKEMREAFELLHAELIPSIFTKGKN
jgi:hypothetical protein